VPVLGLLLVCSPRALAALEVPYLAGRVNDTAGMVPEDVEARLETRLAQLEQERGAQIVVLTVPSLEGDSLEDFSLRVVETWKLGRGDADDGALLLIARDDRKLRIEVGYGLEPVLTDATSRRILENVVRPRFREGDFADGIEQGVAAMIAAIEGDTELLPQAEQRRSPLPATLGGCLSQLLFFVFLLFVLNRIGRRFGGRAWSTHHGGWLPPVAGGGRRRGGFSGGGFSGRGFSGGGGGFGGGGASSGW
jgi:uncharacterized protein